MNFKTTATPISLALTIILVFTVVKVFITGKKEFRIAEEYLAKHELTQAVNHYERAIQWHMPFSQTPNQAAEKLWTIAQDFQVQNRIPESLKTYRLLRGAFYSVRSIYTPGKKWIQLCNEKIAHLMAKNFIASQPKTTITFNQKKSQYLELLQADRPPYIFASVVNEIGFFGWVASALLFIVKALSPQGGVKQRPAFLFFSSFIIFYSLWIWGMFKT